MNVVLLQQMKLSQQWDVKQRKKALEMANLDPQEIELIIVATTSGSHAYPSSACQVQGLLGIEDAISFDLAAACTGFVYALGVADKFIRSGSVKKALVIGADLNSRKLDETDRSTVVLFGDGAGAVILEASEQEGIISTHLHASPDNNAALLLPQAERGVEKSGYIEMQGNETFKLAVRELLMWWKKPFLLIISKKQISIGLCHIKRILRYYHCDSEKN